MSKMIIRGKEIIDQFFNSPDKTTMNNLIRYSRKYDLFDEEILHLANGLANSGERISLNAALKACDIPSTGGPSSLSTLICPLFLGISGNKVFKLGVPGRPAGGIDVLAQISGYNINPDSQQLNEWIKSTPYVHFLASKNFAPLDALLFSYRKEINAMDIFSLVIASLISKKIAAGLSYIGLDIRVSDFGNFGKTWDEARQNGIRFNKIANLAGIQSKSFLTNGFSPQQPYIGRGESILALQQIFSGNADPHLLKHLDYCFTMANSISINKNSNGYTFKSLSEAFYENIRIQGGEISSFLKIATQVHEQQKYYIRSSKSGILSIDMQKVRRAILNIQSKSYKIYADPCGLILKAMPNTNIEKGDVICTFRCDEKYKEEFKNDLTDSFGTTLDKISLHEFEEIS